MYVSTFALMGTTHKVASIVFFQIRSADNKLSLLDRLWTAAIGKEASRTEWRPVHRATAGAIKIRNALAHFELNLLPEGMLAKELRGKTKYPIALTNHHMSQDADEQGRVKALFLEQLDEAAEEFATLAMRHLSLTLRAAPRAAQTVKRLPQEIQQVLESIRQNTKSSR